MGKLTKKKKRHQGQIAVKNMKVDNSLDKDIKAKPKMGRQ